MATIGALAATVITQSNSHVAFSHRRNLGVCRASGYLPGKLGNCEKSNDLDCYVHGKQYPRYHCTPPVTSNTTLNSFEKCKDGDGPSECNKTYHRDKGNGGHAVHWLVQQHDSLYAKVVDEGDSIHGCNYERNFEAPCDNNIVGASPAVCNALGLDQSICELRARHHLV